MSAFKYSVKFVLQQNSEASKPTPLRCFVRYNNTRSVFSSGVIIEPRYWNPKAQEPRQAAAVRNIADIKRSLKMVLSNIDIAFGHLTTLSKEYPEPESLKELCLYLFKNDGVLPGASITKAIGHTLTSYMKHLISETVAGRRVKHNGAKYAPGTTRHYNSAQGVISRYASFKGLTTFNFSDITLDFYHDLREYAYTVEKLSDNYFGTVIKFLKTCMNESAEEKLHSNNQHNSKRFVKVQVDVENVYLNKEQLEHFAQFDFSNDAKLERVRDLFLVGCWTGLRFSDFNNIQPKNISDDFIEIKTQKTGETVAIPIHDTVRTIMSRYAGKTENSLPPSISNVKLNDYIKDAAKKAGFTSEVSLEKARGGSGLIIKQPLYKLITTHTARRAFASNMFRMGVPTIVIMAITGHRTEKAFMKYIKVTPKEKAEIMREIWNRQSMKAI